MSAFFGFHNIFKSFNEVPVLRGVSLAFPAGSVTGLVGGNGAGKSTLMNLAGGNLQPDSGSMTLQGRPYMARHSGEAAAAGIAFVHQELNLFPNLTIAENLFLTSFPHMGPLIRPRLMERQARVLLERVGLSREPGLKLERLSTGERQLVEIAKALHGIPQLIILDEPTTSLTAPECQHLFTLIRKLRGEGCAFVYISHALRDVLGLCDSIAVLRDGVLADQGPVGEFDATRLMSGMAGRVVARLFPERAAQPIQSAPLLDVRELGQPGLVSHINFTLHQGEILGLSGLMGAGRTELARILFGLDPHASGEVRLEGRRITGGPRLRIRQGMAFLTESRGEDGICAEASVHDNVALSTLAEHASGWWRLLSPASLKAAVHGVSESVQLRPARGGSEAINRLSGGNQQKAVLARWLLARPRVLILDEPTRGIDAVAKFEIYQLILRLAAGGTGILLISSEQEELTALCDRILVLSRGRIAGEFSRPHFDEEALLRAAFAHHQAEQEVFA